MAYTIWLELPGVDKNNIDVTAADRTLVVNAERRNKNESTTRADLDKESAPAIKTPDHELLSEFRLAPEAVSSASPKALDHKQVKATYHDEILEITASKTKNHTAITVEVES